MPKMKTDKGAAKRFKITGTGKIRRRKANRSPPPREEVVAPDPAPRSGDDGDPGRHP